MVLTERRRRTTVVLPPLSSQLHGSVVPLRSQEMMLKCVWQVAVVALWLNRRGSPRGFDFGIMYGMSGRRQRSMHQTSDKRKKKNSFRAALRICAQLLLSSIYLSFSSSDSGAHFLIIHLGFSRPLGDAQEPSLTGSLRLRK